MTFRSLPGLDDVVPVPRASVRLEAGADSRGFHPSSAPQQA